MHSQGKSIRCIHRSKNSLLPYSMPLHSSRGHSIACLYLKRRARKVSAYQPFTWLFYLSQDVWSVLILWLTIRNIYFDCPLFSILFIYKKKWKGNCTHWDAFDMYIYISRGSTSVLVLRDAYNMLIFFHCSDKWNMDTVFFCVAWLFLLGYHNSSFAYLQNPEFTGLF